MRRTIKMFGMAAVASLALSTFAINAAQAGHTWEVNSVKLAAGASETCKATADGTMTLHGVTATGVTIHLTSTAIATTGCKITQVGSGATAAAVGSIEKITFSGITVDSPVGCKTTESISTGELTFHIVTIGGPPAVAYLTVEPEGATSGPWDTVILVGCAAAESYPVKGQACAEMPQVGVLAKEQTIKFSAKASEACPGDLLRIGPSGPVYVRGGLILDVTSNTAWGFTAT